MKFVSYNVNGIRAALNKGFKDWLIAVNPDVIGLQEVKALENQIDRSQFEDLGYHIYWHPAVKKGYSGVAILSKIKPNHVEYGMDHSLYDDEGRIIRADFDGVSFLSAYFPSGTTGDVRQDFKYRFLDDIYGYSQDLIKKIPNLILSGDYNICHKPIDIHNPISNKNSSGFLPEERAWMDKFTSTGFEDSFRLFNQDPHQYTWWSYRAGSRGKNLGWRIDYHMTTSPLREKIKRSLILPDAIHSDHCPILIELN
ncbi:exodeoxyribonuclease III [Rhodonellum psychrophilum GCM71 = DSM 17998]|uniref:Exodeoxyribonuclease III n=2 Tax=Rhodonellum TaxID=336827 RepID=U5C0Z0_9BACT|nr:MULTISPECIES: exodeoxyribonuclease III [Rhodonellum]ERM83464.1 exodeoxyribonuclease III [Rhodonellum psychrophilum GCM71 = DSM 17998]SDY43688.1 exodeoxyribonuclease-3 [Rhodonellum ikkaensis]